MQDKNNITLSDITERFREYNRQHGFTYGGKHPEGAQCISAVIVYKQSNFTKPYSEEQRSYRVNNLSGKRFFDGMLGDSVFGDCLDGSEEYVRLDCLDWETERCVFETA